MKPRVLITVLCGTERHCWINPDLCENLIAWKGDPRFDMAVQTVRNITPVEYARNLCVVAARDGQFDWLVMIDNDIAPPNVPDILSCTEGRDVIGVFYPVPLSPWRVAVAGVGPTDGTFQEVERIGAGVLLIRSTVWKTIPGPWFKWVARADETLSWQTGEDFYFCDLVREHGFTIWAPTDAIAGHFRTVDLTTLTLNILKESQQDERRNL